jgi:hypothetical protein
MHMSKVTLVALLFGAAASPLCAQPASPEAQGRAVELLRQTIAQDREHGTQFTFRPTPQPVSNEQQQQAVQLLRQKLAEQDGVSSMPPTSGSSAPAKSTKSLPKKKASPQPAPANGLHSHPGTSSGSASAPAVSPAAPAAPNAPGTQAGPAGLTTKQQRLNELLDQYKADKLTPSEYQIQRAKILAEP